MDDRSFLEECLAMLESDVGAFPIAEPGVPAELIGNRDERILPYVAGGHDDLPDSIVVNSEEISAESGVKQLRRICEWLGLSKAGAKWAMYSRICKYMQSQGAEQDVQDVAHRMQKDLGKSSAHVRPQAEKPSDEEVKEHAATHLPFKAWCDICVQAKSRDDYMQKSGDYSRADDGNPCIQMDFMYIGQNCVSLLALDTWSRLCKAIPVATKAATRQLAEAVVRFSLELNYINEEVVFAMDGEKSTVNLLDMVVDLRRKLGHKAVKCQGKAYDKGRTAKVERHIQTIRNQALALTLAVEENIGSKLSLEHGIRAWALHHAGWLLNRYHSGNALGMCPYEVVYGRPYTGKIVPFGEYVYGLRKPLTKTAANWHGGIWLGKNEADMDVVGIRDGVFRCKSVRRTSNAWRKDVVEQLECSPWMSKSARRQKASTGYVPMPVIREKVQGEPGPDDHGSIADEAASDPNSVDELLAELDNDSDGVQQHGQAGKKNPAVDETGDERKKLNQMTHCFAT